MYTTAFCKYIRDDLTIKEETETRIAPVSKSKEPYGSAWITAVSDFEGKEEEEGEEKHGNGLARD